METREFGTAVVLCGGKSTRMGFDKRKLKLEGHRISEYIGAQLAGAFREIIFVVDEGIGTEIVDREKYMVVEDVKKDCGPMGGILTGLLHAQSEYVFFTACDMPFFDVEVSKKMMADLSKSKKSGEAPDGIVALRKGFIEPLHGYYHRSLADIIRQRLEQGDRKINQLIRERNFSHISEEEWQGITRRDPFRNLNTPSDIASIDHELHIEK